MGRKKLEIKKGEKFGRLTIIEEVEPCVNPSSGQKIRMVKCQCDCGSDPFEVRLDSLRYGKTQSCGCLRKQKVSEVNSKANEYDLSGEYGIGYTCNGDAFYFDLEDYDLIKDYCWCIDSNGYMRARDKTTGKKVKFYRLIMQPKEDEDVDHINRDKLDNRKANLRVCSRGDNVKNRGTRKNSTSGVTGVTWNKQASKWQAQIMVNGKFMHLGYFTDINEAIKIRVKAELEFYKEYAPTYFCFTEDQRQAILNDELSSEEIVEILKLNEQKDDEQCI